MYIYMQQYKHISLTHSMVQSPSWEANWFLQLVKKFPAFYGTRRFITALTSVRHLSINIYMYIYFYIAVYMLSSKMENAHWAEKTTKTRCGIRETATTRNCVLWLFLNNRKALWHVKICHDAKVVLWLLTEMTTTCSDFMKISQTAEEMAYQLMEIFCMFGAPFILQSDNGREFANKIIQNLADMWPGMKLVHGKPRHSQSRG